MIKALIFDFDGLILDTETPEYLCWQEIYQAHGVSLSLSEWADYIGSTYTFDPHGHLERKVGHPVDRAAIRIRRSQRLAKLMAEQSLLPGVQEYIAEARKLGLKLGLASSSRRDWIAKHLSQLGLASCFDAIRCGDDVERTKPDPAVYLAALRALKVAGNEAIALEDSPNGVLAAKRAGLFCVAVPNALTRQLSFDNIADLQLASLTEMPLRELLPRFNAQCEE